VGSSTGVGAAQAWEELQTWEQRRRGSSAGCPGLVSPAPHAHAAGPAPPSPIYTVISSYRFFFGFFERREEEESSCEQKTVGKKEKREQRRERTKEKTERTRRRLRVGEREEITLSLSYLVEPGLAKTL